MSVFHVFQIEAALQSEEKGADGFEARRRATSGESNGMPVHRRAASVTNEVRVI